MQLLHSLISGVIETVQENIVSVRNANVQSQEVSDERDIRRQNETVGTQVIDTEVGYSEQTRTFTQVYKSGPDPLAQTFVVEDNNRYLSLLSVMSSLNRLIILGIPVIFELRTVENGSTNQKFYHCHRLIPVPDQINVSDDGSVATTFTLKGSCLS